MVTASGPVLEPDLITGYIVSVCTFYFLLQMVSLPPSTLFPASLTRFHAAAFASYFNFSLSPISGPSSSPRGWFCRYVLHHCVLASSSLTAEEIEGKRSCHIHQPLSDQLRQEEDIVGRCRFAARIKRSQGNLGEAKATLHIYQVSPSAWIAI